MKSRTENETQSGRQTKFQARESQANTLSLSAGSSTSYASNSCIGDRFSVPGNANGFLPGVDEFVLEESVWGVAFKLPVEISSCSMLEVIKTKYLASIPQLSLASTQVVPSSLHPNVR